MFKDSAGNPILYCDNDDYEPDDGKRIHLFLNDEMDLEQDKTISALNCNGWFLKLSDEIHYGVPKVSLNGQSFDNSCEVGCLETGNVAYLRDHSLPTMWQIKKTWQI